MILVLCIIAFVEIVYSLPQNKYWSEPRRSLMYGTSYGYPVPMPGSSMTISSGDSISTNSFAMRPYQPQSTDSFPPYPSSNQPNNQPLPANQSPSQQSPAEDKEDEEVISPDVTKDRRPGHKDEKEENDNPWLLGRGEGNYFFPILFGGQSRGKGKSDDEPGSSGGSVTAIANSFSTGKGGVATSHATAFGDSSGVQQLLNRRKNLNSNKYQPQK